MVKLSLIITCLVLIIKSNLIAAEYNIKDLEILESEGNYEDFIKHAFEIRPSERSKLWKKMLQNMATVMIDKKIESKSFSPNDFKSIQDLSLNSALFSDNYFQFKRQNYVTLYLKNCFQDTNNRSRCIKDLELYWSNSLKDADFAHEIVKILKNSNYDIWYLVEVLTFDQMSSLYCQKDYIQKEIIKKVQSLSFDEKFDGHYAPLLSKLTSKKCQESLSQIFEPILFSPIAPSTDKEMALDLLIESKKLTKDDKKFYYLIYFLNNPVNGENLNQSWQVITNLSLSLKERENLLKKIQELPKIPEKLFIEPQRPREKAFISHLAKNFPELLNFYANECLKLFQFSDQSKAASTNNCQNFFTVSKAVKNEENKIWINESIHLKESAIKRP